MRRKPALCEYPALVVPAWLPGSTLLVGIPPPTPAPFRSLPVSGLPRVTPVTSSLH